MTTEQILSLAFGIPFFICLGTGLGIFLVAVFLGVDLTSIFRKDDKE